MTTKSLKNQKIRKIIGLVLVALAFIILYPQAKSVYENRELFSSVSAQWLIIAILVFFISPFFAALSYYFLSKLHLNFKNLFTVQVANGFINRVLPSGSGALGTGVLFLKKSGHSTASAVSLTIVNNAIGFISFIITVAVLGLFEDGVIKNPLVSSWRVALLSAVFIAFAILIIFATNNIYKKKIIRFYKDSLAVLITLIKRPAFTALALLSNFGITALYIIVLAICIYAIGYTYPISQIAYVFAVGITAVSISPTPNGLGVAELAISVALQSIGLSPEESFIVALSYRVVTYWIPILPGYIAYQYIIKKNII